MGRIEEIDREISQLQSELETVEGTETEVYSRIVGYYRSLKNWNRGKREEFRHRALFAVDDSNEMTPERSTSATDETVTSDDTHTDDATAVRYELFVRDSCPNCPPMKEAARRLDLRGELIDVDDDSGMERAVALGIYSTPTIIFFDDTDSEISRSTSAVDVARQTAPV